MSQSHRIVSLVPSLTELVIDLGLKEELVGRTRFCVHPKEQVEEVPIIGGTKNPRLDKIRQLNPTYIIANHEENRKADIQELQQDFPVTVTEIGTIEDALITITNLGNELGATEKARRLATDIQQVMKDRPDESTLRATYLIWKAPWMTVGNDTYIHDVLTHWKLENVFKDRKRYPKITLEQIGAQNPDVVLLSSEPFPFKEKHLASVQEAVPNARILLVEGEWFSWYGSHMLHSFQRLNIWRKAIA